jgi:hypothetical protein
VEQSPRFHAYFRREILPFSLLIVDVERRRTFLSEQFHHSLKSWVLKRVKMRGRPSSLLFRSSTMAQTNFVIVNGQHIFICPWTGLSRPHRYGFPTFTEKSGKLDYLTGSYMTPGCALKHLESLVVEKKVSEKKAKEMVRGLVDFLGTEV